MNQTFMKEKKILPLVLSMALPMVVSMAVNSLYNIIDSYFIAKLSEDAMTALSLVFPAQNIITSVAVGFGVGINAAIAFFLGAKEQTTADLAASQGVFFNLIHGVLLTILGLLGMKSFLSMYTSNTNVLSLALTYANLVFLFAPVVTVGITYEKIFQAIGWMKETMICMLVGFVTNIILDPLLIFGIGPFPKWGIWGAAFATGSGQVLTLVAYFIFYYRKPRVVHITIADCKPNASILKRLYGVGIPATLNMALPSFLISVLNAILAGFSETYVMVLGVYYKLQTFIYLSATGIVQGIRPLVGYNYGAGEGKRVRKIYATGLVLTVFLMVLGTTLSWIYAGALIWTFYHKCHNAIAWRRSPTHHQYWLYHFCDIRDHLRRARRYRHGTSILNDFLVALLYCYHACCICAQPYLWCHRCMDGISDCGDHHRHRLIYYLV